MHVFRCATQHGFFGDALYAQVLAYSAGLGRLVSSDDKIKSHLAAELATNCVRAEGAALVDGCDDAGIVILTGRTPPGVTDWQIWEGGAPNHATVGLQTGEPPATALANFQKSATSWSQRINDQWNTAGIKDTDGCKDLIIGSRHAVGGVGWWWVVLGGFGWCWVVRGGGWWIGCFYGWYVVVWIGGWLGGWVADRLDGGGGGGGDTDGCKDQIIVARHAVGVVLVGGVGCFGWVVGGGWVGGRGRGRGAGTRRVRNSTRRSPGTRPGTASLTFKRAPTIDPSASFRSLARVSKFPFGHPSLAQTRR